MMKTNAIGNRQGLTLVELLVVIAIIGLLVAVLLPAVQSARSSAHTTQCKSQMRQIGIAIALFADGHDGRFPRTYHAGDKKSWIYTVAPHMEDVDEVRICPLDPVGETRLENKGTSYVINSYISIPGDDSKLSMDHLKSKSQTMIVFEGSDYRDPESFYFEHAHPDAWFTKKRINRGQVWLWLIQEIQPDRHASGHKLDATLGVSHYLFADGHVEAISAAQIKGWADEGYNFAKPDSAKPTR